MNKIFLTILILLWCSGAWGATYYVEPDINNPTTKIMYNVGDWPSDNPGTRVTNKDLEDVRVAAGDSGIIILSGGESGITYSGTMLDSADGLDITTTNQTWQTSTDNNHNGTVTISGVGLSDYPLRVSSSGNGTIIDGFIIQGQSSDYYALILEGTTTGKNLIIKNNYKAVYINSITTLVNCFIKDNIGTSSIIYTSGDVTIIGSYLENNSQITVSGKLTLINTDILNFPLTALRSNTGGTIDLINSIVSGCGWSNKLYLPLDEQGGTITIENTIALHGALTAQLNDITTSTNAIYTNPMFTRGGKTSYVTIIVDDTENMEYWEDLCDIGNLYGVKVGLAVNSISVTSENYTAMAAQILKGHFISSHTKTHSDLGDRTFLNLNTSKGVSTGTVSIVDTDSDGFANNLITYIDGIEDINITITDNYTIGQLQTALNGTANYTSALVYDGPRSYTSNARAKTLALIDLIDIKGQTYEILCDDDNYFNYEINGSKSDIETGIQNAGIPNFELKTLVTPYNSTDESSQDAMKQYDYIAGTTDDGDYLLENNQIYNLHRIYTSNLGGIAADEDTVRIRTASILEGMNYLGGVAIFWCHAATDFTTIQWEYVFSEISKSNVIPASLDTIAEYIRTGTDADADGERWTRTLVDESNYFPLSTSPVINKGTVPFVHGDGDQYDMAGVKVWDDTTDKPVGPWIDGVEIGAYGKTMDSEPITITQTINDLKRLFPSIQDIVLPSASNTLTGTLSDLPASAVSLYVASTASTITGGSTAMAATGIKNINLSNTGLNETQVDGILTRIYTDRASFTETDLWLLIGGDNAAPSGTYEDEDPPTTGLGMVYELVNDPESEGFNKWQIFRN